MVYTPENDWMPELASLLVETDSSTEESPDLVLDYPAPGYAPAFDSEQCANCAHFYTAKPDGTGWANCDLYDFEVKRDWVCDSWEAGLSKATFAHGKNLYNAAIQNGKLVFCKVRSR